MKHFNFFFLFLFIIFSINTVAQEICDNGIDDDFDGLVDLNDVDDCFCLNIGGGNNSVSSIIPNASFEETECCPFDLEQLDCATTWIQASIPTTDYFNTCDYSPDFVQPIDGIAAVGGFFVEEWQEYVGSCLLDPFVANEDYILQMNIKMLGVDGSVTVGQPINTSPVEITVFGSPDCSDLPWSGFGCPLDVPGDWVELGSYTYEPNDEWIEISILLNATMDINAVAIGPGCDLPPDYSWGTNDYGPYAIYDNLILNEASLFSSSIDSDVYNEEYDIWVHNGSYTNDDGTVVNAGDICSDLITLTANVDTLGGFQWFYEGVAMFGETDTILSILEEDFNYGTYQFMLSNPISGECSVASYTMDEPELPTMDFNSVFSSVCSPSNVDLEDESIGSGGILNWEWYMDNVLIGEGSPLLVRP